MKKFRTGIIALILCILASFTAFAAQGTISFSDPEVTVGDEVNVTMKITADEGTALNSANIVLTYPSDKLEFVSGTDAEGGAGAVRVHGASNGKGTAELAYNVKFKTSEAGTFNIGIDSYEVYDKDDQPIEFTHLGSSAIKVSAQQDASTDCALSALDVYPGNLDPAFSADNATYSVTVGLNVEKLNVNAIPADGSANVKISNNENLPEGDSTVVITVTAADGSTSLDYVINVSKVEGGAESTITETHVDINDGVQLSAKTKTITILNPPEDVPIPDGFKQGTISIDDQKVQGWVWGASESPEYCVVYAMNDKGEINFYRYDMVEKTIQRYFEDPLAANAVSNAEYSELKDQYDASLRSGETRLIILVVIAVIAFAAIMACIYLWFRLKTSERMQKTYRKQSMSRYNRDADNKANDEDGIGISKDESEELLAANELLKHDFSNEDEPSVDSDAMDETQVIRRPERKRRARRNRVSAVETENADLTELDDLDADQEESSEE